MKALSAMTILAAMVLASGLSWAQDKTPQPEPKKDPAQEAADAQRKALEALAGRQEVKVTIQVRNARVSDIVDEFRRQVPYMNFVLDDRGWSDDFRVKEFIVTNEAWRTALAAFAVVSEAALDEESPTLIRLSRPARLTLSFKDAPIKTVIDLIARMSRANIILHPDVQGSVTMSVNDVPWSAVLDAVVKTVGNYTTVREKYDIIRIVPESELLKQMEVRVFKLKFIQPPPTYRASMEENKYLKGKTLTAVSSVAEMKTQFTLLDVLKGLLTRNAGGAVVGTMEYTPDHSLISVRDTKIVINKLEETLKLIDVEPEQVQIDVKFISTINEDLLTFGTDWTFQGQDGMGINSKVINPFNFSAAAPGPGTGIGGPFTQSGSGKVTRLPFGLGDEFQKSDQYFLSQFDMTATFRAFKRDKFSKIIQGPTLSVIDNTEATIFVGEQVPYAETRAQANQFGGLEFTIAEGAKSPVRVGFQLLVIPKIIPDTNKVIMTIIPVNEFLSGSGTGSGLVPGFERFTLQGAGQGGANATIDLPRVATTTLVTRLMVESGRTAVLGGLVNERSSYEDRKVPFLGDIPIISYLFKSRNDSIRREHLMIFITPRIVRSSSQQEETLRALLKDQAERERRDLEKLREKTATDDLHKRDDDRKKEKEGDMPK